LIRAGITIGIENMHMKANTPPGNLRPHGFTPDECLSVREKSFPRQLFWFFSPAGPRTAWNFKNPLPTGEQSTIIRKMIGLPVILIQFSEADHCLFFV
jgi:hypothetical protein